MKKNRIPGVIKLVPFKWKNKKFWLENKMVGTIRGTAAENMGCDLGQCNFSTVFSLFNTPISLDILWGGLFSYHVKFYSFMIMHKLSTKVR